MTAAEIVRDAEGMELRYDDDVGERLRLLPPARDEEVAALASRLPCPVPDELRDLLAVSRGFENGPLESMDFLGLDGIEAPELLPYGFPIAHDGFGNYWVVDLTPASTTCSPIFFLCHDPPVLVLQTWNLSEFLLETLKLGRLGEDSLVDWVHEEASSRIWREQPGAVDRDTVARIGDPALTAFADTLEPGDLVVDLRQAQPGDGLAWGRFGPRTPLRRHGDDRIFSYRKQSLWQRLFG
jgi:hypothetical protein